MMPATKLNPSPTLTVVWIDQSSVKLYWISEDRMARESLLASGRESLDFYQEVEAKLSNSRNLLLVGPGLAKTQFGDYLSRANPELYSEIIATENMDHPTDFQIANFALRFLGKAKS